MIIAVWALWGSVCAAIWRFTLPRFVFRHSNTFVSLGLTYAAMAAFFGASLAFIEYSGWNFKGVNDEPIQKVAEALFFFSPFGLPLMFGGPIFFVIDGFLAVKRKLQESAA